MLDVDALTQNKQKIRTHKKMNNFILIVGIYCYRC